MEASPDATARNEAFDYIKRIGKIKGYLSDILCSNQLASVEWQENKPSD